MTTYRSLRVTVGATIRLQDAQGRRASMLGISEYGAVLGHAHGGVTPRWLGLSMPWHEDRRNVFKRLFATPDFQSITVPAMSEGLLPLRRASTLTDPEHPTGVLAGPPVQEDIVHPFAVTRMIHYDLGAAAPQTPASVSSTVDAFLDGVVDGVRRRDRAHQGAAEWAAPAAPHSPVGVDKGFELVSAFVDAPQASGPSASAPNAAALIGEGPGQWALSRGELAQRGGTIGLVVPAHESTSPFGLGCLHNNDAFVLALLQNLAVVASVPSASTTVEARAYRVRAHAVATALSGRQPIFAGAGVYKSRIAEVWHTHLGIPATLPP